METISGIEDDRNISDVHVHVQLEHAKESKKRNGISRNSR